METIPVRGKAVKLPKSDPFIMVVIYAAALTLHVLITGAATIFNLTPDEYSVTAIAAYLNGLDWSPTVSTGGYYGYFQSLFYVPVFRVTDDPYLRYRLMLVINGVLMSFVPVIAYWLSRRAFDVNRPAAAVFSLICGLYPSYMLLTNFTWNETMCCLLPWIFLLLLYNAYGCGNTIKKQALSCLGGLTLAAAYATHGRMLSLVAAGIVLELVVFFSMKRTRLFCFSGFFGGTVVGLFTDKALKRFFQGALWNVGSGKSAPINTIEKMMSQLFGENGRFSITRFFQTLIGHFFYFFSSTWGFGAVCAVMIIMAVVTYYRRRNRTPVTLENGETDPKTLTYIGDKAAVFCWFSLLLMGAAFAVSVLFKSTSSSFDKRMDTTIYGRYTEAFYPVAILCTLVLIYKGKLSRWQTAAALGLNAAAVALTQLFTVPIVTNSETFVSAMVLGLAPMRYGEGLRDLYTQTTFLKIYGTVLGVSILWTIVGLIKRLNKFRWAVFCVPLAGLLIWSGTFGYLKYTVPQAKNAKRGADIMTAAVDKLDGQFGEVTLFATARDRYVKTQFLYPEMTVRVASTVSAYRKLESKSEIVLANIEETPELWFDELRLVGSLGNAVHIYAASERAYEWAVSKGYRLGESGAAIYTPAELKTTSTAVKTGYDEYADLDYASEGETVTLTLPKGAAAYTNYTHLQKGTYAFTVYGEGVNGGTVTLYADKGKTELPFEILTNKDGELCAAVSVDKKTENVRFTFTNTSGKPINVEKVVIRRMN
ncbi:MAG: hypothetical protein HDR72_03455 [Ruminococcaceae bacterium]|nr:hypothetical protein [Oscillospiraceae bacterium]